MLANDLSGLALLTDLYQLTMAYGYWKTGRAQRNAIFHLYFRSIPFGNGFAIAGGQGLAESYLQAFRFEASDLEYLATLVGNDGGPLWDSEFLNYLAQLKLTCDIDAMPEGTLVFPEEPILRVTGPILQCQLLETGLLNLINFSTLIATKAARICQAAQGDSVLEFGLRRAQGPDGGLSASRAAYLGGCAATSNVLAGKRFGIPVRGTHAHSWVMSYEDEREAFQEYARALPNNCVFLVDTYDTLEGVRRACQVGHWLRSRGHRLVGIRLDSGDLAYLSIEARKILDDAGFPDATIVASNDLDEQVIESLKLQGARIALWGVGTRLATAFDQPALGGVYKLGAVRDDQGRWHPRIKLSQQAVKTSIPGCLQVRRFRRAGGMVADMIYDSWAGVDPALQIVDPRDPLRTKSLEPQDDWEDLLKPWFREGQLVSPGAPLDQCRDRVQEQLTLLHPTIRRRLNPHSYPVGLDFGLSQRRQAMMRQAKSP
jgi:nicotinate phosphoribosyltransferase